MLPNFGVAGMVRDLRESLSLQLFSRFSMARLIVVMLFGGELLGIWTSGCMPFRLVVCRCAVGATSSSLEKNEKLKFKLAVSTFCC